MSKEIVVTGAFGFIGSHVANALIEQGHSVILVDDLQNASRPEYIKDYRNVVDVVDWRDYWDRKNTAQNLVVHLGAVSETSAFMKDILDPNVWFTKELHKKHQGKVIFASSASVYGTADSSFKEDAPLRPQNHYALSKVMGEKILRNGIQFTNKPIILRLFNVYGKNEGHKRQPSLVSYHAKKLSRGLGLGGDTTRIRLFKSHRNGIEDGAQRRDFVYVNDVVDVILFMVENYERLNDPERTNIYNVGTGEARSFYEFAEAIADAEGKQLRVNWEKMPYDIREHYQYYTRANINALRAAGYTKPFTHMTQAVKEILS